MAILFTQDYHNILLQTDNQIQSLQKFKAWYNGTIWRIFVINW